MAGVLALGVCAVLALSQHTDTTVAIRRGDRLDVYDLAGAVTVRVWERSAVRIVASHSAADRITVARENARLSVASATRIDAAGEIRYEISIPAWLPVTVQGTGVSVTAEGALEDLTVKSQSGNIVVRGTVGSVNVSTMLGSVDVVGAKGKIRVSAGKKPIRITRVAGEVAIAGVDNDIILSHMDSRIVDARTVTGSVGNAGAVSSGHG